MSGPSVWYERVQEAASAIQARIGNRAPQVGLILGSGLGAYADDFDVVYGSRTARMFIWRGANMGLFLRWGNWAVAKMMEFLFNSTNLTDVGCTMRLIHRQALRQIEPDITIGGSSFGPEMMILTLLHGQKVIQIPVNYLPRVGESSVTGDFWKAFFLGMTMIGLVLRYRLRSWLGLMPRRVGAGGTA